MRRLSTPLFLAFLVLPAAAPAQEAPEGFGCDFSFALWFDEAAAPADFDSTQPLGSEYEGQGITFAGPAPGQGGAVLNENSGFGVVGHSSPNFLAFDTETYADGPETFEFFGLVRSLFLQAGLRAGDAGTLTLECFDPQGNLRGSSAVAGSTTLQTLQVQAAGIDHCTFSFTSQTAVIDNLSFTPCDQELGDGGFGGVEVPVLGYRGLAALALALAATALVLLARRGG